MIEEVLKQYANAVKMIDTLDESALQKLSVALKITPDQIKSISKKYNFSVSVSEADKNHPLLKDVKPSLGKITSLGLEKSKPLGVICPIIPDAGKRFKLSEGDDYVSLNWKNKNIDGILVRMGIPCRHSADLLKENGTFAIDGYSANILTDEELKHILSQNVIIDGKGVEILLERGFGSELGVKNVEIQTVTVNAEIINKFKDLHPYPMYSMQYLVSDYYNHVVTNHKITLLLHVIEGIFTNYLSSESLSGTTTSRHELPFRNYLAIAPFYPHMPPTNRHLYPYRSIFVLRQHAVQLMPRANPSAPPFLMFRYAGQRKTQQ